MNKSIIQGALQIAILLIAVLSLNPWSKMPIGNTVVLWSAQLFSLIVFLRAKKYFFDEKNKRCLTIISWFLLWNSLSVIHGIFVAQTYWDWKALAGNAMVLFIPIATYVATDERLVQAIFCFYMKYILPLFFILAFFIPPGAYGFYLAPVSMLLLFLPGLTWWRKLEVLAFVTLVLTVDLAARSNVIKFGVPLLLYCFRYVIPLRIVESLRLVLMAAPFVFFVLAITSTFNVFNIKEYTKNELLISQKKENGEVRIQDLRADTRTFLYEEVLRSAKKHNTWLIGRSPARGNDTELFLDVKKKTGKKERQRNEVGILNVFTWTGIVGVILYFLIFYKASYLAVNLSENYFIKLLGLYVAFRWCYAWVEDINMFSLGYLFLWIALGLCFSKGFRKMTDADVERWARGIFDKGLRGENYGSQP